MEKNKTLVSENVLDSELHPENFWILNFVSESKIHLENEFHKKEVLDICFLYEQDEIGRGLKSDFF